MKGGGVSKHSDPSNVYDSSRRWAERWFGAESSEGKCTRFLIITTNLVA